MTLFRLDSGRINAIRGLACVLLVSFHTAQSALLHIPNDIDWIRGICDSLTPLRMPLFTFLSGLVYAWRPVQPGRVWNFEIKKVQRLLIPMTVITILLVAGKDMAPAVHKSARLSLLPYYLTHGYEHLWFLQSLFLIFLVVALVDSRMAEHRLRAALILFAAGCVGFFLPFSNVTLFSIGGALYLAPFFAAGMLMVRGHAWFQHFAVPVTLVSCTVALTLYVPILQDGLAHRMHRHSAVAFVQGLAGILSIVALFPHSRFLAWLGQYSYTIYLFHFFFFAVANRVVHRDIWLLLALSLACGLLMPVAVEIFVVRFAPWLGFAIGKTSIKRPSRTSEASAALANPAEAG